MHFTNQNLTKLIQIANALDPEHGPWRDRFIDLVTDLYLMRDAIDAAHAQEVTSETLPSLFEAYWSFRAPRQGYGHQPCDIQSAIEWSEAIYATCEVLRSSMKEVR